VQRSTPVLELGIPAIDDEHRELFAHAEAFGDAFRRGGAADELARLLDYLTGYAERHFVTEERFLERIGFPDLELHRREHQDFARRLRLLAPLELQEGPSAAVLELVDGISAAWLRDHVGGADRAYADWWQEHRRRRRVAP
jgi:hemerythrin